MSRWSPCRRREFIRRLKSLGFQGPWAGAKHEFMVFQQHRLAVPSNPEYSLPQLRAMVREVAEIIGREISADDWNSL